MVGGLSQRNRTLGIEFWSKNEFEEALHGAPEAVIGPLNEERKNIMSLWCRATRDVDWVRSIGSPWKYNQPGLVNAQSST